MLVVGLGNRNVTADALGTRVVERTLVTRHLGESLAREMRGRLRGVSAIAPGVLGLTGIETAELCRGLIQRVRPAAVVAIDALAAFDSGRICSTIQITNTGIEPGSGVGNHRLGLTEETLGVRVIAVGVPMVVYASTIARDAMARLMEEYHVDSGDHSEAAGRLLQQVADGFLGNMVVTPREIDEMVLSVADLLSEGLNRALQPSLDEETLHTYLHALAYPSGKNPVKGGDSHGIFLEKTNALSGGAGLLSRRASRTAAAVGTTGRGAGGSGGLFFHSGDGAA
ncbi:MAG: GPR endopeptidase [Lachnospiraceae bacterium]